MKFEEQFPSLKNTGINLGLSDVEEITKELIQKHCIDKKIVKEIIDRTFNLVVPKHKRNDFNMLYIALLEELKLEWNFS